MNGSGNSDRPIVPKKAANKEGGRPPSAERLEGRGLAKGNPGEQTRFWTQGQLDLHHALGRIRHAASYASLPKAGARCGNAARRDLRGGRPARVVPTATGGQKRSGMYRSVETFGCAWGSLLSRGGVGCLT